MGASGYIAYITIAAICVILVLAALDKIREHWYSRIVYFASLLLMWESTLAGSHIIGSDMAGEYFVANSVLRDGFWSWMGDYGTQSSTSFVVGWLVPSLSRWLSVDPEWIFKVILPVIFAFTPTILFTAFRRQFGAKTAFYSAIFFMIVPVTTLEVAQIGKAMVAEAFMALTVYILTTKWKWQYQLPSLIVCIGLAAWAHYTVGLAALAFVSGILIVRLAAHFTSWKLFAVRAVSPAVLAVSLLVALVAGAWYFTRADGGSVTWIVGRILPAYSTVVRDTITDAVQTTTYADVYVDKPIGKPAKSESLSNVRGYSSKFERQEGLVKTAVGLDFAEASIWGKMFRVVQFATQLLILLGALFVLVKGKRLGLSAEFVAGIGCALLLLAMVVFIPQFSMIINATRFYHFSLFFLAPMLVIGLGWLTRARLAPAALLIVYFLFTSGIVFELTKWDKPEVFDTPYSIPLSAERTGVVATYSDSDVAAAKWLAHESDQSAMIVGDYNGWHLVSAYIGLKRMREEKVSYNPTLESLPEKPTYIFLTSWNTRHQRYIESIRDIWGGAGLRESRSLPDFSRYPVVYRRGNAVVYQKTD